MLTWIAVLIIRQKDVKVESWQKTSTRAGHACVVENLKQLLTLWLLTNWKKSLRSRNWHPGDSVTARNRSSTLGCCCCCCCWGCEDATAPRDGEGPRDEEEGDAPERQGECVDVGVELSDDTTVWRRRKTYKTLDLNCRDSFAWATPKLSDIISYFFSFFPIFPDFPNFIGRSNRIIISLTLSGRKSEWTHQRFPEWLSLLVVVCDAQLVMFSSDSDTYTTTIKLHKKHCTSWA